jgi:hypothetical protein
LTAHPFSEAKYLNAKSLCRSHLSIKSDPEKLAAHAKLSLPALATMVAFWSPGVLKECQTLLQPISMLTELAGARSNDIVRSYRPGGTTPDIFSLAASQ